MKNCDCCDGQYCSVASTGLRGFFACLFVFLLFFFFKMWSYTAQSFLLSMCMVEDDLESLVLLLLPPNSWDYTPASSPCLTVLPASGGGTLGLVNAKDTLYH